MLALVALLMMSNTNLSVLTVPITLYADPIEEHKTAWVEALHQCENPDNIPWIWDTNGLRSYGAFMFQKSTWISYGKNFGATMENIDDDKLQAKVVRSMLDKGLWRHWYNCSKEISKTIGDYLP